MIQRDSIRVDIDKDRIRDIVKESLRIIEDYTGSTMLRTDEQILGDLEKILTTNRISTMFYIRVPIDSMSDLKLRVDPRKKKILGVSSFKKKVSKLNRFLRIL